MHFSLDVLRARKGDCLMLHYGPPEEPRLILIDGGPSDVYEPSLRPRLVEIRALRELADDEQLPVEAVMVSHVDDDHIKGILELTREQLDAGALPLAVESLWHNSFDDILKTRPKELDTAAGFGAAALKGEIRLDEVESREGMSDEEVRAAVMVLASIPQGRTLRDDAGRLKWKVNRHFGGKLILATREPVVAKLEGGVTLTVVGPMQTELEALQEAHDDWLREQKDKKKAEAALAAYLDKSVPNLSSIVMLADAGGKSMLLTGDARGDKILEGLQLVGRLGPGQKSRIDVDVLKVPHHGSANNLETGFFERVVAKHYVFSGDGEHGNPEREALEMLLAARGDEDYEIHLTYPVKEIDEGRRKDWDKERKKQLARKKKNPKTRVREEWSPKKHGLAALFNENAHVKRKLRIVESGKPHVIDLLDPIGF